VAARYDNHFESVREISAALKGLRRHRILRENQQLCSLARSELCDSLDLLDNVNLVGPCDMSAEIPNLRYVGESV
jgi:hypothetical protein